MRAASTRLNQRKAHTAMKTQHSQQINLKKFFLILKKEILCRTVNQLVGLGKVDQKLGDLNYKSENEDRFKLVHKWGNWTTQKRINKQHFRKMNTMLEKNQLRRKKQYQSVHVKGCYYNQGAGPCRKLKDVKDRLLQEI